MAQEANIRTSLSIRKTDNNVVILDYQSRPTSFNDSVTGTKGPTPGSLTIPVGGKVISFQELITPGYCVLKNMDDENYIEYGIRDPDTNRFYPLGEVGPGEVYVLKLSRNLLEEYAGTGTGTSSPGNQFFMKANGADVVVSVEAFER